MPYDDREFSKTMKRLILTLQELSAAHHLPAIQRIVKRAAREIAGCDGVTFVLLEGSKCYYADEDAIAPLWKGQRFPLEACISGWVMQNGTPAVIRDIYADSRIPHDAYRPTFVKSLVMVPIRTTDPIGAIGSYWATEHEADEAEVATLQALADATSLALENAQLYAELSLLVRERTTDSEKQEVERLRRR